MRKVNTSSLHCIHQGCGAIPTIVLEWKILYRVLGQIITCPEHREEGINMGSELYQGTKRSEWHYPKWLQRLHEGVLQNSMADGRRVVSEDVERLRSFMGSGRRLPELR